SSWMLRLAGTYTVDNSTSLTASVEHGDAFEILNSFKALREGVTRTGGTVGLSRGLAPGWSLFGTGQFYSLTDGNLRASGFGSLSYAPWSLLTLDASCWMLHYSQTSNDLYWDPTLAVNLGLGANFDIDLPYGFRAGAGTSGGLSFDRTPDQQDGRAVSVTSVGPSWDLKGRLGWNHGRWKVLATAGGGLGGHAFRGVCANLPNGPRFWGEPGN